MSRIGYCDCGGPLEEIVDESEKRGRCLRCGRLYFFPHASIRWLGPALLFMLFGAIALIVWVVRSCAG